MMKQNNSSRTNYISLTIYLLYLMTSFINATETVADIVSKSEALMGGKTQAGTHGLVGETKG